MDDSCVVVFTSRSIEKMQAEGGSQAWVLDASRARQCRYLVCAWNPTGEYAVVSEGRERGEAYMVAPITSVETAPPPGDPRRSIIRFTEFARISVPNAWTGQRNPVYYSSLSRLGDRGVDVASLSFETVRASTSPPASAVVTRDRHLVAPLTIAAAKQGLAAHYGVTTDAIEILIRG